MKRTLTLISILLVAFVVFQGTADAKVVLGKVDSIDATAKTLSVSTTDPATGAEEKVSISVPSTATFSGVTSLDELKAGDAVEVEAEQDVTTSGWNATSVKTTPAAAPAPAAAPEAPAPSKM